MMFGLGTAELAMIFLIVIIVFGAKRIPMLGKGLGQGIKDFRKALKEGDEEVVEPIRETVVDAEKVSKAE